MKLYAAALDFDPVAHEFNVLRDFPIPLHEEAAQAHDRFAAEREDLREIPFVTLDPLGSRDLDQAVYIEKTPAGFRVHYAIADVAAFIVPGGGLEEASIQRGQTIYLPDAPARLHPEELSEGLEACCRDRSGRRLSGPLTLMSWVRSVVPRCAVGWSSPRCVWIMTVLSRIWMRGLCILLLNTCHCGAVASGECSEAPGDQSFHPQPTGGACC